MDQKLVQFVLLGTLIITAYAAWRHEYIASTRVYDILPASEFPPQTTYTMSPEIGLQVYVSEEECTAIGNYIGRAVTTTDQVTPRTYGVKYQPTSHEYVIMSLANCGGGVYVKVIGNNRFHVYHKGLRRQLDH